MRFLSFFQEQFKDICKKYGLKAEKWGDRTYVLIGSNYVFEIVTDLYGALDFCYIRRDTDGTLKKWKVSWYIATSTEDQDRYGCLPRNTMMDGWINNTIITSHLLERQYQDLLSGGTKWMEDFKKSQYYSPPRNAYGNDLEKAQKHI